MDTKDMFLKKAEEIARIIYGHVSKVKNMTLGDILGPGDSGLGFFSLARIAEPLMGGGLTSMCPEVYGIFLFGSVARGEENPTDIDLMIIDNGHFSEFLRFVSGDNYGDLSQNLSMLMTGYLGLSEEDFNSLIEDIKIDLHALPLEVLDENSEIRAEVAVEQKDPNFFENIVKDALIYNNFTGEFEKPDEDFFPDFYHNCISEENCAIIGI